MATTVTFTDDQLGVVLAALNGRMIQCTYNLRTEQSPIGQDYWRRSYENAGSMHQWLTDRKREQAPC